MTQKGANSGEPNGSTIVGDVGSAGGCAAAMDGMMGAAEDLTAPIELPAGEEATLADPEDAEEALGEEDAPGALPTDTASNPSQEVGIGALPPRPRMDPAPGMPVTGDEGTPAYVDGV